MILDAPPPRPRHSRDRPGLAGLLARRHRTTAVAADPPPRTIRSMPLRDGSMLPVNVFLPTSAGPWPVLVAAGRRGHDPRWLQWTSRGYAVVTAAARDLGARDYYDLVEWAAVQPWASGKVGLDAVCEVATVVYQVAALRPPHLAAICPWDGFTDFYQDIATLLPDLARVEVPALLCAGMSAGSLHARGSFEAFHRLGSTKQWLYTHRGGTCATYDGPEAGATRERFFDWALRAADNGQPDLPPVRLEDRAPGGAIDDVWWEQSFPPDDVSWLRLALQPATGLLDADPDTRATRTTFHSSWGVATLWWRAPEDLEVIGPIGLRCHVGLDDGDADLFAGVWRYRGTGAERDGFDDSLISRGWVAASHRVADPAFSRPGVPVHTRVGRAEFEPGEIAPVDLALLPCATTFLAGDLLRLDIQGHWFDADPQPVHSDRGEKARVTLHGGGRYDSYLELPVRPVDRGSS